MSGLYGLVLFTFTTVAALGAAGGLGVSSDGAGLVERR